MTLQLTKTADVHRVSRLEVGSGLALTQVQIGSEWVTKIDTAAAFGITQEQADVRYVIKTGDTMTGALTTPMMVTNAWRMQASTQAEVQNSVGTVLSHWNHSSGQFTHNYAMSVTGAITSGGIVSAGSYFIMPNQIGWGYILGAGTGGGHQWGWYVDNSGVYLRDLSVSNAIRFQVDNAGDAFFGGNYAMISSANNTQKYIRFNNLIGDFYVGINNDAAFFTGASAGASVLYSNLDPIEIIQAGTVLGRWQQGSWTTSGWGKTVQFPNATAIRWGLNAAPASHGIGQTTDGLYFFRSASEDNANPPLYTLLLNNSGNATFYGQLTVQSATILGTTLTVTGVATFQNDVHMWSSSAQRLYGNSDPVNYYVKQTSGAVLDIHWYYGVMIGTAVGTAAFFGTAGSVTFGNTSAHYYPWSSSYRAMELGQDQMIMWHPTAASLNIGVNTYYDGVWRAMKAGQGALFSSGGGGFAYYTAASVSAGAANTLVNRMQLDQDALHVFNMVRASGWYGPTMNGGMNNQAAELGVSGGTAYLYSYNRSTSSYGLLHFGGTAYLFQSTGDVTIGRNVVVNQTDYSWGLVGTYDPARYRLVYSMGPAYMLASGGTGLGNLYGLFFAYDHPSYQNVTGQTFGHGVGLAENGSMKWYLGSQGSYFGQPVRVNGGLLHVTYAVSESNPFIAQNSSSTGYGPYFQGGVTASRYVAHFVDYAGNSAFLLYRGGTSVLTSTLQATNFVLS